MLGSHTGSLLEAIVNWGLIVRKVDSIVIDYFLCSYCLFPSSWGNHAHQDVIAIRSRAFGFAIVGPRVMRMQSSNLFCAARKHVGGFDNCRRWTDTSRLLSSDSDQI